MILLILVCVHFYNTKKVDTLQDAAKSGYKFKNNLKHVSSARNFSKTFPIRGDILSFFNICVHFYSFIFLLLQ